MEIKLDNTLQLPGPSTPCSLPERFRPKQYEKYKMTYTTFQPKASFDDLTIGVVIEPETDDIIEEVEKPSPPPVCTEGDLSQALSWIRHQLAVLKQEDKDLLERFYEIRAKMNKLRNSLYHTTLDLNSNNTNSASDPSINNSTSEGVDFAASSLSEDVYLGEFRSRTVSLLPPRSNLTVVLPSMNRLSKAEEFL